MIVSFLIKTVGYNRPTVLIRNETMHARQRRKETMYASSDLCEALTCAELVHVRGPAAMEWMVRCLYFQVVPSLSEKIEILASDSIWGTRGLILICK